MAVSDVFVLPAPHDFGELVPASRGEELEQSMDNQALTFDSLPPESAVAKRAAKRITELDARAEKVKDEIALLEEQRPRPDRRPAAAAARASGSAPGRAPAD